MSLPGEAFLAAAGALLGYQPDPCGQVPARLEDHRVGNKGTGEQRPDAGYLHQPASKLGLAGARHDLAIILEDLRLHHAELRHQQVQTGANLSEYAAIIGMGGRIEQTIQTVATDRRHEPELSAMRPQGVGQLRPLAAEDQTNKARLERQL